MYEEPYRWIEAVNNRRQYLDDQFKLGSPVVGLSYQDGILLLTFSRGTPKLYEIYDRIGLGGMGHPADLEKLRLSLLEMAHLEGFNRSPSDVTGSRLLKYGLAPTIKTAFEDIFKAPFIVKFLLAQLGVKPQADTFLTMNYDGSFEEVRGGAAIAATDAIQTALIKQLQTDAAATPVSFDAAVRIAAGWWASASLAQQQLQADHDSSSSLHAPESPSNAPSIPQLPQREDESVRAHLQEALSQHTLECAVLNRTLTGSSKYQTISLDQARALLA
jgi:proteasome alpha subunit